MRKSRLSQVLRKRTLRAEVAISDLASSRSRGNSSGFGVPPELEGRSKDNCAQATSIPEAAPSPHVTADPEKLHALAKALGTSAGDSLLQSTLRKLSQQERVALQTACYDGYKEVALWKVLAKPMATGALEGWQGIHCKAVVAGIFCGLSAAGCDASAHVACTAALVTLQRQQQQQHCGSPSSTQGKSRTPTAWSPDLLAMAVIAGIRTLDGHNGDTYETAAMVVGDALLAALSNKAGEVLLAASAALYAWSNLGVDSALVKQALRCAQTLLAATLARHVRGLQGKARSRNVPGLPGESFSGGMPRNVERVARAIVSGSRYAVAATAGSAQETCLVASMGSRQRGARWCGQCMRCTGLATLLNHEVLLGVGGDFAGSMEPALVAVVESVLLRRLAEALGGDEAAGALEGAVRVMAKQVIEMHDGRRLSATRCREVLRKACTGDLNWSDMLEKQVSKETLDAVSPILVAVLVFKLQEVCQVQEAEILKPFAKMMAEEMVQQAAGGVQQAEPQTLDVMVVLHKLCTGKMTWQDILEQLLSAGKQVSKETLDAVSPILAAVLVSKLQEVCQVQEAEILKPFAKVVAEMVQQAAGGAQQAEPQTFDVMVVLHELCTGEKKWHDALKQLLAAGEQVSKETLDAVSPILAAVLVSKLQEVCQVQEAEILKPFAKVVAEMVQQAVGGAQQAEPQTFDVMVVLHELCTGEKKWHDALKQLLAAGEQVSKETLDAVSPILAAVLVSKLQEVCQVQEAEILKPFAKAVAEMVQQAAGGAQQAEPQALDVLVVLHELCTGKLTWQDILAQLLSAGEQVSQHILEGAIHLVTASIICKLRAYDYEDLVGIHLRVAQLLVEDKHTAKAVESLLGALLRGHSPDINVREVMMVALLISPQLNSLLTDGKAVSRLLDILVPHDDEDTRSNIEGVYNQADGHDVVATVLNKAAELLKPEPQEQLKAFIQERLVARQVPQTIAEQFLESATPKSLLTGGIDDLSPDTLESLEEKMTDRMKGFESTVDKLERNVNPSALVELAKEQIQGNWGSQLLQKLHYYFMHRILPLVDLGTDGLVAASLWEAGGQQRHVWFWVTVTFMVLPYAVLAVCVTIHWQSFWNLLNPAIWRMKLTNDVPRALPHHELLALYLRKKLRPWIFEEPQELWKDQARTSKAIVTKAIIFIIFYPILFIIFVTPFCFPLPFIYIMSIPALVILDVLLAVVISPDQALPGPFWASYEQLKKVVEGFLEALPQAVVQVILVCLGNAKLDSTLLLSLFISILQTFRHISYLREQGKLNKGGVMDALKQLLLLENPYHVPFSDVLRIRAEIDFRQVARKRLESWECKQLSKALIGNTELRRLVFKCDQIDEDGMRFLLAGLIRSKLRELEFRRMPDGVDDHKRSALFLYQQQQERSDDQIAKPISKLLLERLPALKVLHTLRLDNLESKMLDTLLKAAASHGKLRHISLQKAAHISPESEESVELPSIRSFVEKSLDLKSLELTGFNLERSNMRHLAMHKGISFLKMARCKVHFAVCHEWSGRDSLSTMVLFDVELHDPEKLQLLVERPATCDIFVVVMRSTHLITSEAVKLADNLGKPSRTGEINVKQPRLVLVGSRPALHKDKHTPAASIFSRELKRAQLAIGRSLAFLGSALSVLSDARVLLSCGVEALYANSQSLTTDAPSLAAIKILREYFGYAVDWELVALSGWPQQVSHMIAAAVCKQLGACSEHGGNDASSNVPGEDVSSTVPSSPMLFSSDVEQGKPAGNKTGMSVDAASPPSKLRTSIAIVKWIAHRRRLSSARKGGGTTLVLNNNTHDDSLSQVIISEVMRKGMPRGHHIQHLYLRSNAFTARFFKKVAQHIGDWSELDAQLDLIDNDLDSASLFPLVNKAVRNCSDKPQNGSISIRLTESHKLRIAPSTTEGTCAVISIVNAATGSVVSKFTEFSEDPSVDKKETDEAADNVLGLVQSPEQDVHVREWGPEWPTWFDAYVIEQLRQKSSVNGTAQDKLHEKHDDLVIAIMQLYTSPTNMMCNLSGSKIGDRGAQALARMMSTRHTPQILQLDGNWSRPEGAQMLAVALTPNEKGVFNASLNTLDLNSNGIGNQGAKALAVALTLNAEGEFNASMNTLNLKLNHIGDEGAEALAVALTPNAKGVFNTSLNTLDLASNRIGAEGAKALAVALTPNEKGVFNTSLNTLNLGGNELCGMDGNGRGTYDTSGIKALAESLVFNTSLNTLNLCDNGIGDEGAKALAVALTPNAEGVFNTSLNTLDLDWNAIGPEGAKALADALTPNAEGVFNTSLNTLNLNGNNIGPEGAKALAVVLTPNAEGVFNTSLNTLDLGFNGIGPEGAKALADALTPNAEGVFNTSLNTLDLNSNQLCGLNFDGKGTYDASGIKVLAEALVFNTSLNTLKLSNNELCGVDQRGVGTYNASGIKALADALAFNTSLNTLDLDWNGIGPEGAKALADALTPNAEGVFNTSLNTLGLENTRIGPEGAKALAVVLTPNAEGVFNTSLNTLNLLRNNLEDDGRAAILAALEQSDTLTSVCGILRSSTAMDLTIKDLSNEDAKLLAGELVFNGSMNTLNLKLNRIGPEGAEALAVALTPNAKGVFNTSLNMLDLRYNELGSEGKAALQEAVRKHPNAASFKLVI
ncbi:hypothetical protein CYMTET_21093 [Cymbomonas tetramitiformis]|uniref:Uncharacterized protein n=1 Tax=Cymbomonas tetramitiformis TaxID=36881 RepID=A0AAE0L3B5_9CHLO|nr:hypothetical protein CYMTET_21093 [Cymbomonas tetramitiformis]